MSVLQQLKVKPHCTVSINMINKIEYSLIFRGSETKNTTEHINKRDSEMNDLSMCNNIQRYLYLKSEVLVYHFLQILSCKSL